MHRKITLACSEITQNAWIFCVGRAQNFFMLNLEVNWPLGLQRDKLLLKTNFFSLRKTNNNKGHSGNNASWINNVYFENYTHLLATSRICGAIPLGKGKVRPITGPEGEKGCRGLALLIRDLGARRGWVVSITPRPLSPGESPGTHCTGTGWAPGPVWTGVKNLSPTGIRSPDRPARSQ
jgi:hypothetical protein